MLFVTPEKVAKSDALLRMLDHVRGAGCMGVGTVVLIAVRQGDVYV